jgi:hypothetical protein
MANSTKLSNLNLIGSVFLALAAGCTSFGSKLDKGADKWILSRERDEFSEKVSCRSVNGQALIYYEPFRDQYMLFLPGTESKGTFIYYYRLDGAEPVHGGAKFENDQGVRVPLSLAGPKGFMPQDKIPLTGAKKVRFQVVSWHTGEKVNYSFDVPGLTAAYNVVEECQVTDGE